MPRGDKSAYTEKQKRKAEHIEEGYETRGVAKGEAERRAWATVNKQDHGGKQSGSARAKKDTRSTAKSAAGTKAKAASNSSRAKPAKPEAPAKSATKAPSRTARASKAKSAAVKKPRTRAATK